MRHDQRTAVARAAGWTSTALPVIALAGWLLGSALLAAGCWVTVLAAQTALAWRLAAAYPALGPWVAVTERRPGALRERLYAVTGTVRRMLPGDGLGFIAALSGPLIVGGVLTMATWLPWAWRAVLVGGTAIHLYGVAARASRPDTARATESDTEPTRPDNVAGRWAA